ncbi:MAG: pyridoxamine 5'-phosphate oxidase family protein [Candidatus Heimdallarchaeota archaeon]|nr:pyridoxamine 5'-phosphate oxidase family protein [Candidatus Heimdallarchaeota archaeon]MCK5184724.1 pyridoxamine 5'-phosphate oxidase family protein [Candidatus Heimdallarchaeota archaeon]MCK5299009.1 pyridoxamine 5'-phosphate oxidase family protein [Candidatus Heimdallarchaeota archaeon]
MRDIRRKERAITEEKELLAILQKSKYVTIAMCQDNEPYLVTMSHGYDPEKNCIYFHCAKEGKKIDILKENNVVWGQALFDEGYIHGECSHNYATTMFKGTVSFLDDFDEKKAALHLMVYQLEDDPEAYLSKPISEKAITNVTIGRIDIEYMSGKKAKDVVIDV